MLCKCGYEMVKIKNYYKCQRCKYIKIITQNEVVKYSDVISENSKEYKKGLDRIKGSMNYEN